MRGLALGALWLVACGGASSDETRYLSDGIFRRERLIASLVNPNNRYSRLRVDHYERDWNALPEWNPPAATLDAAGSPRADEAALDLDAPPLALGEAAFFRYPVELAPTIDASRAGGLVSVRFADGSRGIALSCSTCHARVVNGKVVPGLADQSLDLGRLVGADWGPGRVDVAVPAGEEPVAIPDLRPVAWLTHLHRDGTVRNDLVALAIRIETLIVTSHAATIRPPRQVALALARYLWSLASPPPVPSPDGTPAARGAHLFEERCASCHQPPGFSGPPVPLAAVGTDARVGLSADRGTGGYRVPSLRGVSSRGALLHDGTVPDVAALFDPARTIIGHPFGLDLAASARDDLLAYLATL